MPRECVFCGKRTRFGNKVARRGLPKKVGGIGLKTTGIRRRSFKPNLQKVRAVHEGKRTRILVCTGCIKKGLVVKQPRPKRPPAAA